MVQADQLPLVQFKRLHDFDSQPDCVTQILVGAKGTGKSTALVRKAAKLSTAGIEVIPNHLPYVNQLEAEALRFPEDRLGLYATAKTWTQIWKLVLAAVFGLRIAATSEQLAVRLKSDGTYGKLLRCPSGSNEEKFFDEVQSRYRLGSKQRAEPITPLIGYLLDRSTSENECFRWYNNYIKPLFSDVPDGYQAAIFLDCVDEAFAHSLSSDAQYGSGHLVWTAAQVGLIDAAYELARQQSGLRVYAAIRLEAYLQYTTLGARGLAQVDEGICLRMDYSVDNLIAIFEDNVRRTPEADLVAKSGQSLVARFFGVEKFQHPRVWGTEESALQWLIRHTFGSPRHLVWHGAKLWAVATEKRSTRANIAPVVNSLATLIFEEHKNQLIPTWDRRVDYCLTLISNNVLSAAQVKAMDARMKVERSIEPFLYLFQRGMLGYPIADPEKDHRYKQHFLPAGTWLDVSELPAANYFVIHPCLNQVIEGKLPTGEQAGFVSSRFIAGHGLNCPQDILPIKYCVAFDPENRTPVFCYFPYGVNEVTANLIAAHTVKDLSDVDHAPTALFFALLCASTEGVDGGHISRERIHEQVYKLRSRNILREAYGKGKSREVAETYFSNLMQSWCEQQPDVVTTLKRKLAENLPDVELASSSADDASRASLMLKGIAPSEVLVLLR
jgi:hypothetical protein